MSGIACIDALLVECMIHDLVNTGEPRSNELDQSHEGAIAAKRAYADRYECHGVSLTLRTASPITSVYHHLFLPLRILAVSLMRPDQSERLGSRVKSLRFTHLAAAKPVKAATK